MWLLLATVFHRFTDGSLAGSLPQQERAPGLGDHDSACDREGRSVYVEDATGAVALAVKRDAIRTADHV